MPTDRPNSRLCADVEIALVLAERAGAQAAWFLVERGADFALICRVLAGPELRRKSNHCEVRVSVEQTPYSFCE